MAKWFFRILIPAMLIFAIALPFWIKKPNGEPVAEWPSLESLVPAPVDDGGPDVFYKWQDDKGGWHYSDTPPEGVEAQAIAVDPDTNLVPGQRSEKKEEDGGAEMLPALSGADDPTEDILPTPDRLQKLVEDAHQAKETLEQRYKDRDKQLENL